MTHAAQWSGGAQVPFLVPGLDRRLCGWGMRVAVLPAAAAWVAMVGLSGADIDMQLCAAPARDHFAAVQMALSARWAVFDVPVAALEWALMVTAMMLPLIAADIDHMRARMYRAVQTPAVAAYVMSYLGVWMVVGGVVAPLAIILGAALHAPADPVLAILLPLLLAALWWGSDMRRRLVLRCHYRPTLAPEGRAAIRGAAGHGVHQGLACVAGCAPVMLGMHIAGGGLWGMALLAFLIVAERRAHRPDPRGPMAVLALFGALLILS